MICRTSSKTHTRASSKTHMHQNTHAPAPKHTRTCTKHTCRCTNTHTGAEFADDRWEDILLTSGGGVALIGEVPKRISQTAPQPWALKVALCKGHSGAVDVGCEHHLGEDFGAGQQPVEKGNGGAHAGVAVGVEGDVVDKVGPVCLCRTGWGGGGGGRMVCWNGGSIVDCGCCVTSHAAMSIQQY